MKVYEYEANTRDGSGKETKRVCDGRTGNAEVQGRRLARKIAV